MIVPALTQVGVPALAAHMFVFYYAVLSEVSPPTALSPFAAAALTHGAQRRAGVVRFGSGAGHGNGDTSVIDVVGLCPQRAAAV